MDEHRLTVNTLALLVEEGFPARLATVTADALEQLLRRETERLVGERGIRPEFVAEAVCCWVAALRPDLAKAAAPAPPPKPAAVTPTQPVVPPAPAASWPARPSSTVSSARPASSPVLPMIHSPSGNWLSALDSKQVVFIVLGLVALIWFLNARQHEAKARAEAEAMQQRAEAEAKAEVEAKQRAEIEARR